MRKHSTIDASAIPELRRLIEEAREIAEPIIVRLGSEDMAILTPLPVSRQRLHQEPSQEQIDVVMSAAGSWEGLADVDELKKQWRAGRGSSRPHIKL